MPSGATNDSGQKGAPAGPFIHPGYRLGFALVTSLFFLWAIANNFNDILIRQFQKALALNRLEAGLIQFVYFIGYFTMAVPAGLIIRRFGYRTGILAGLFMYAVGALLFYPAAQIRVYGAFLGALYVIACGAAFLETAANPYVAVFGDPSRAAQRLNFAQAFFGMGSVLAPVLGGMFIFSGVEHSAATLAAMSPAQLEMFRASEARMVEMPYITLAGVVTVVAAAVAWVKLPPAGFSAKGSATGNAHGLRSVLREPNLISAVIAQFFYIGAQVCLWSFFVDFVKETAPQYSEKQAAYLLSAGMVLFMGGRFAGAALMTRFRPSLLLLIGASTNVLLCLLAALLPGIGSVAALMVTSLFGSIIFPTIFALGIGNLGERASLGASLLIMSIVGGAILPPLMGLLSQAGGGLRLSLAVPLASFVVVTCYAWRVRSRT